MFLGLSGFYVGVSSMANVLSCLLILGTSSFNLMGGLIILAGSNYSGEFIMLYTSESTGGLMISSLSNSAGLQSMNIGFKF